MSGGAVRSAPAPAGVAGRRARSQAKREEGPERGGPGRGSSRVLDWVLLGGSRAGRPAGGSRCVPSFRLWRKMPVRKQDTQRALHLLEEYRSKLSQTEDRQLRSSIERVINIFQSNLFQALIDIQEFYEVTLLDNPKCVDHSKQSEPVQPVSTWEIASLPGATVTSDTLPSSLSPPVEKYRYQDEEVPPPEHISPQVTNEVLGPELVHVSEKNLSEIENVHGFVSHSHISPIK
ncbi:hypothetical protein STEG23_013517, partial [Scotinomys teguina]